MSVSRKLLEGVLVYPRLRRLTESDLINRDYAIASVRENIDGRLPCHGTKIFPVQQDDDLTVERLRFQVHIGHVHYLLLGQKLELMHGEGIVIALQLWPVRELAGRTCIGTLRSRRLENGDRQEQERCSEESRHGVVPE